MPVQLGGVAVVTGASGGIGGAVARALAGLGLDLCLTGRNVERLNALAREIGERGRRAVVHAADLSLDEGIRGLAQRVAEEHRRVDVLVHAIGAMRLGNLETAGWDDADVLYRVDLRAPFLLTKALLPLLKEARGQVVFINSTAGLAPRTDNGLYAAMKRALRSLADSVRTHVNPYGVRVLSVFPGRTLTPLQLEVQRQEGRRYDPAELLRPSDVADVIVAALNVSDTAEVTEIVVRPMRKPSSGSADTGTRAPGT